MLCVYTTWLRVPKEGDDLYLLNNLHLTAKNCPVGTQHIISCSALGIQLDQKYLLEVFVATGWTKLLITSNSLVYTHVSKL